jgi:hypothetical protein
MGERILFQAVDEVNGRVGPVVYAHWAGEDGDIIAAAVLRRCRGKFDPEGATPWIVYEAIAREFEPAPTRDDYGSVYCYSASEALTADDTHGDGGIVLFVLTREGLQVRAFGGYWDVGAENALIRKA